MAAYVIVDIDVKDAALYEEYRAKVNAVNAKYGGKFIARGGEVVSKEGGWTPKRIVIVEFPTMEQALKWYDSPEYKPLLELRERASTARVVIVEGL
jgi:uncharacterized protein (DUF1330 family)